MRDTNEPRLSRLLVIAMTAAIVAGASAPAGADDTLAAYTKPESKITLGIGALTQESRRFAQYTGLDSSSAIPLLNVDFLRRDDATGTWLKLTGRNLGLDSRDFSAVYERQGHWGVSLDYSQIVRNDPLIPTTSLAGIGTASVVTGGTTLSSPRLATERDRITFGMTRSLPANFSFEVRYRHEDKDGARLFGRGSGQFLAEPIDARTQQIDAMMKYTGKRLQLVGGYYGSFYNNRPQVIDVSTGTDISLPPDNSAQQLYVSGGYSMSKSTRATFKLAYGRAIQDDNFFIAPDLPGNTRTTLDGKIDTLQAQFGISSRPLPRLSLLANLRYEDRDDKTPRFQFLTASTGRDGFNTPFSRTTTTGKLEASYLLPLEFRLTGGIDHEKRKRSVLSIRQASWREENDETSYRLELRRSMSATINGALSLISSNRGGSDYLPANNNAAADFIDPIHFADRKRDKLRFSMDWTPTETLSIQVLADSSHDNYDGRPLGPKTGKAEFYSIDSTLALTDNWQGTLWFSTDRNNIEQLTITSANGMLIAAQTWGAKLRTKGDAFGFGLTGRVSEKLELSADFASSRDENNYGLDATVPPAALLPDIVSRHTQLRSYARYAIRDRLGVRVDYVYDGFRTNDWTWNGWEYADGSTLLLPPSETGSFIGLSMYFAPRW